MVQKTSARAAAGRAAGASAVGRRDSYTVQSLLAVTAQVFNARGYDGTSMEDLSRAAGISKSSIYHHVRGKEELLRLAVGRALDRLFAILDEPEAVTGPAVGRLEHVVRRTAEVLLAELPYVTLLLRVRGNTSAEQWALDRRREFDRRVAGLVQAAVAEGDLRADVPPRLATRLLFGMINSIVEWYQPADGASAEVGAGLGKETQTALGIVDAVVRIAFEGLRRTP
jgi:AcrR family transcriptional regulator